VKKENKAFKIFRVIITLIAIVFLLLFVSGAMWGIVNIGNLVGGLLCVWLIFVFGTRNKYKSLKEKLKKNIFGKIVLYGINFCFTALLCYGLIVTGLMTFACIQQPKQNATAIVLGAQVTENGPSMMLTGRINSAVRYLQENPDAKAVLTGGQGSNEPMSEAQAMYNCIVEAGISPDRLYIEDKAVNTGENIAFSEEIIKANGLNENKAIVTDGFHQLRAQIITKQQGLSGSVGSVNADTFPVFIPTFAVREWFALPNQVLFR
jgi:uncharacterized SAM-binding protein YcdF (DUF218 family)